MKACGDAVLIATNSYFNYANDNYLKKDKKIILKIIDDKYEPDLTYENITKLLNIGYNILLDFIYSSMSNSMLDFDINFKSREKGLSKMDIKFISLLISIILQNFIKKFF